MRNVTEIQRYLIASGYLAAVDETGKPNDDGVFGTVTLAAYNRARAAKGEGPHTGLLLFVEVNADLWPDEQPPAPAPRSNPITDYLTQLAIKAVLANLTKGLPVFDLLKGYKTYIAAFAMILTGIVDFTGTMIPGSEGFTPLQWVFAGIVALTLRSGLNTVAIQVAKLFGIDVDKLPKIG